MDKLNLDKSNVWVVPDPISSPGMLYAGTLLYFDTPIVLTIPPQVITPESFELLDRVRREEPDWSPRLFQVVSSWQKKREGTENVLRLLEPLSKNAFYTIWPVYNSDNAALRTAEEFITSAGWTSDRFLSSINIDDACGELVRHLFLEKYLELDQKLDELYGYAGSIFSEDKFPAILSSAYGLRLLALVGQLKKSNPIALTNPRLVQFLADLPASVNEDDTGGGLFQKDAVSMMIFNGLLANWLDPLSQEHVEIIVGLRGSKRDEINRLKGKCLAFAEKIDPGRDTHLLAEQIDREIQFSILPEVKVLLELRDAAFRDYKERLLADRTFWTGFIGTIVSAVAGAELVSAGAAVSTIASMGATAFSQYRDVRQTVRKSDYSLVYTVSGLIKRQ